MIDNLKMHQCQINLKIKWAHTNLIDLPIKAPKSNWIIEWNIFRPIKAMKMAKDLNTFLIP